MTVLDRRPGADSGAAASPLPLRAALLLAGWLLGLTVVVFGGALAIVLLAPAARVSLAGAALVVALTMPAHALGALALVHVALRRNGTGWVALGFARPTRRLLHLLWQVPALLVVSGAVLVLAERLTGSAPGKPDALDDLARHVGPVSVALLVLSLVVLVPIWEEASPTRP